VKRFATIVADPPWEFEGAKVRPRGRNTPADQAPYPPMALGEIEALPIADLAEPDAVLFMWSTRRLFREGAAAAVARAWGFEPCGEVIWGLRLPGLGGTAALRNDHEPILVAKRGRPQWTAEAPMGVHFWRQPYYDRGGGKIHSAKPDAFLDHVELWAPGPYLELFARRARFGWDYWGDESHQTVELPEPEIVGGGLSVDR
jgi:N6-adenosine-specific RNA methylase IME4